MCIITSNQPISGDTNPWGCLRSLLLELYRRSPQSREEEKSARRASAAWRRQTAPVHPLDEGKESEREVRNCPLKRGRSKERVERHESHRTNFPGYEGSGYLENSAHIASYAIAFFGEAKKTGASAAERGRLRVWQTEEDKSRIKF